MLKNYMGKDANGIGATLTSTTEVNCVRCSRCALPRDSSKVAVACINGHVQCLECDNSMKHQCKKCGIPTTTVLQHDDRTEPIDPKTLPPEDLTQLELNAALQQFKLNFLKFSDKKKRLRLIDATSHIIELLNPIHINLYRKSGRYNQIQVEKHFFRTSEKSQHSFAWHKAALDFVMDRTFDMKTQNPINNNGSILNVSYLIGPEAELISKQNFNATTDLNFLKKYTQQEKTPEIHKKQKRKTNSIVNEYADEEPVFDDSNSEKLFLELIERSPLIFMKPYQWLTETRCPHCGLIIRLSDFSKHFAIYHCVPIECMELGESRRIYLDPRVMLSRGTYPHTLFLIKNVVRDLGGSDFRNLFPIVLVTATIEEDELCDKACRDRTNSLQLMVWLSSICLNDEFKVCLKINSERYAGLSQFPVLNGLYPITKPQNLNEIFRNGEIILLPSNAFGIVNRRATDKIVLEISLEESIESTA